MNAIPKSLAVPAADYQRALARAEVAQAQRDALAEALAAVMRTLASSAASPEDAKVYAHAREQLALSGCVSNAEAAEFHAAYAEWALRRGHKDKP